MEDLNSSTPFPNVIQNVNSITFSWYDYILFNLMLGLSAAIGIYFGCFGSKQATANEYLMGGKIMKIFPIAVSLVASHVSGITLLAVPADIYRFGTAYILIVLSVVVICIITMYVFLPVFFQMQVTSTYEYLERRFDSKNRMLASFLFALSMFLYLPIVIYIPALAFSAATGINVHYITPIVCGVCIFYTTLGGLKAVVWTDTLQFIVTLGALTAVFVLGLRSVGGFGAVFARAAAGDRLKIFDFDFDPTKRDTFWQVFIGIIFSGAANIGVNQGCVQKFLSVATIRESRLSTIYFSLGMVVVTLASTFIGLIMYAKYWDCDPFTMKTVLKNDQLLPYFVMDVAGHVPGLPGLFIAGVFCAGLSTLSAHLNCLAGTIYEDFIAKLPIKPNEVQVGYILKILVVITGTICTALVFLIEKFGGILPLAISVNGIASGPLLALFTLGMLCPRISSKGAFYGCVLGLIFSTYMVFGAQYYRGKGLLSFPPKPLSIEGCISNNNFSSTFQPIVESSTVFENITSEIYGLSEEEEEYKPFILFRISFYYYTVVGFIVTCILSVIISWVTKNDDPPVKREVLSPIVHFLVDDEVDEKLKNVEYYNVEKALHVVTVNSHKEK